jgi:hypothetical protein
MSLPVSKLPKENDPNDRRCGLCGVSCQPNEFCHGCKFHICEDHTGDAFGPHDVTEHEGDPLDDLEELS